MSDPETDEELLYSAWLITEGGVHRLYVRDHTSGQLQVTELHPRAVAALPRYLPRLKLRAVAEASAG